MKSLWNRFKLFVVIAAPAIAAGAVVGVYPGYKLYEYVWKDPNFCFSCHVHDYATVGWKESAHGKLTTCHDCHHQPLRAYIREVYLMIKEQPKFPKDLHHTPHVPKDLCEACHVSSSKDRSTITGPLSVQDVSGIPKVDRSRLHHLHLEKKTKFQLPSEYGLRDEKTFGLEPAKKLPDGKERPIACVDCHGGPPNRAHHFTSTDRSCLNCHSQNQKHSFPLEQGCRNCHFQEFMIPFLDKSEKAKKE